ncbi:MAG: T9SS type A sorting domain-containing protein, partial [Clostridiales bacterium]
SDKQLTSIETAHKSIPKIFEISQNFPNPFNPSTTIRYQIPYTSRVTISIYNILGQKLTELVNTIQNPGYYNAVWNAAQVASGIYIYSIQADPVTGQSGFRIAKKMMLVK